jgi:hypothetical protein
MEQAEKMSASAKATARQSSLLSTTRAKTGGKGIRTPDFQLAKLALYQLSYAPDRIAECRMSIADFKFFSWFRRFLIRLTEKQNAGCRSCESSSGIAVDVQQRLNCALPSFVLWSSGFFRFQSLHGVSKNYQFD